MPRIAPLVAVLLAVLALTPEPANAEPPPRGANAVCPVDGDAAKARFAVEHAGQTVYLCCGRCARTFRQDPAHYTARAAELPRVGEPARQAHDHDHDQVDDPAHDPAHDHAHETALAATLHWLGHFHVVTVHFPIGLLLAGAVGELLWLATRRRWLRSGVRFCVWGGAIGAVIAAPLGWLLLGTDTQHDDTVTAAHRWLGTLVFFWAVALVLIMERAHRGGARAWRWGYRAALFAGAILVGVTGHLGGVLVHGADYLKW